MNQSGQITCHKKRTDSKATDSADSWSWRIFNYKLLRRGVGSPRRHETLLLDAFGCRAGVYSYPLKRPRLELRRFSLRMDS